MAKAVPTDPRAGTGAGAGRLQRPPAGPRPGLVRSFEDILNELRKVIWPSWAELRTMTFVVIVTVIVVSLLLGLIDYALSHTLVPFEFPRG